ncbi:MAG TPA: hypothetical protein VNO35_22215 [Steroidobacteraceae bacterium]|nr:hypothetical protein [Steroidobacteraceae bacterium]
MTDPLRPFAQIIRSLWRGRASATERASPANHTARPSPQHTPNVDESLQSRLSARIAGIDTENPARLRQAFVETVLLRELGENLARDPDFGALVTRVCEQLESQPTVAQNLHQLLVRLATGQ